MGTCSACGCDIIPGDTFCTSCGTRHEPSLAQVRPEAGATVTTAASGGPPAPAGFDGPAGATVGRVAPASEAAADYGWLPVAPGYGVAQAAARCPNCGQAWAGSQACMFCGQVWGLPRGIALSSAGRRLGGHLLDGVLVLCTLVIGWIIWTLIVWAQGQTPAKQLLGMRVVRLDTMANAGWGRMFLRDFVGKTGVWMVGVLLLGIGAVVAGCWLLWDKDKQELWDKMAGTVVVHDPDKLLALPA